MKSIFLPLLLMLVYYHVAAQDPARQIRKIYDDALIKGRSYETLQYLTQEIGSRLSGSEGAAKAVDYTQQIMRKYGFDTVYLQPVMVPHWVRGAKETGKMVDLVSGESRELSVTALGNSVGTGSGGIQGQLIEVQRLSQLDSLGRENIEGKIVFFNRPMNPKFIQTFKAYGAANDQRVWGPSRAAKYGAIGSINRSLTLRMDDVPHTGTLVYDKSLPQIPAMAISTQGAEILSQALHENKNLNFYMESFCKMLADAPSYNVIGELKGSEKPEEIIVVGGHLDSWDVGQGAHDDGAGCVQSIEVLRIFKALGYQPKRTIRAVMYMNEENGSRGGREYARVAKEKGEKHIAALESDSGGFAPMGFDVNGSGVSLEKIKSWGPWFAPYDIRKFVMGHGGSDVNHLKEQGTVIMGLMPESQRYFDYHHSTSDTFDKVNKRELEQGAAAMATLIYLIDQFGI